MRNLKTFALACLCALVPASTVKSEEPDVREWDAEFVKIEVPRTVRTNQVFPVAITMKNTGSTTWGFVSGVRSAPTMRSIAPYGNLTWGTNYIIQGQGTSVAPGEEFTYVSNLRAPNVPGKHVFRWQLHNETELYGQPTPRIQIQVTPAPAGNDGLPPVPKADRAGKKPLRFDDFKYLGSFKLPHQVGNGGGGYSESGMTLRKYPDGTERLLINFTHPQGTLFEVDIPDVKSLVKYQAGDASQLLTAEPKKIWGAVAQNEVGANGGMYWDHASDTLYWTYYHSYWTGGDLPILQATRLNDDGTMTPVGSWTVPNQKWHWGGVTRLPKSFADRYTDGKTLALGFGGYFSVSAPCSRGPALSVIAEPDPAANRVDGLVNLLSYDQSKPAPRPGNYFNSNCGYWNEQPRSRAKGTWTYDDHCRSGVMIDLEDKQGYITFPRLGTGRLGYDYGSINRAGTVQYWYFYDTRHLGQAARGEREAGEMLPYEVRIDRGMGDMVSGACFDAENRKLYLIRMYAYRAGTEFHPLIHVYHIKK